jgi:hypothetical protein
LRQVCRLILARKAVECSRDWLEALPSLQRVFEARTTMEKPKVTMNVRQQQAGALRELGCRCQLELDAAKTSERPAGSCFEQHYRCCYYYCHLIAAAVLAGCSDSTSCSQAAKLTKDKTRKVDFQM